MRTKSIRHAAGALALASVLAAAARSAGGEPAAGEAKKEARKDPYDPKADAKADLAAALARAKRDGRRVLVVFGGNWCSWCLKLHDLFEKDREIAGILRDGYERVAVDVGNFDRNGSIAGSFGADLKKHGVPLITVLDGAGKVLVNQDTGELEAGPRHDPGKVKAFLAKWAPEPPDAEKLLREGLERAKSGKKRVLVSLGGPG